MRLLSLKNLISGTSPEELQVEVIAQFGATRLLRLHPSVDNKSILDGTKRGFDCSFIYGP